MLKNLWTGAPGQESMQLLTSALLWALELTLKKLF